MRRRVLDAIRGVIMNNLSCEVCRKGQPDPCSAQTAPTIYQSPTQVVEETFVVVVVTLPAHVMRAVL